MSELVGNPKDLFSRIAAQLFVYSHWKNCAVEPLRKNFFDRFLIFAENRLWVHVRTALLRRF